MLGTKSVQKQDAIKDQIIIINTKNEGYIVRYIKKKECKMLYTKNAQKQDAINNQIIIINMKNEDYIVRYIKRKK